MVTTPAPMAWVVLTSASDATNLSPTRIPHAQGRADGSNSAVVGSVSKSVTYGYNAGGQSRNDHDPVRDTQSAISTRTIASPASSSTACTWPGQPSATLRPREGLDLINGTQVVRSHDTDGRSTGVTSAGSVTLGYDDASRIISATDLAGLAKSWSYGHDRQGRADVCYQERTDSIVDLRPQWKSP